MQFTYLDRVDPTIFFDPVMARNWFVRENNEYSLFSTDETQPFNLPGYHGTRCIIDREMAEVLSAIQEKLLGQGLFLKVYDAYRPQKTVDFFYSLDKGKRYSVCKAVPLSQRLKERISCAIVLKSNIFPYSWYSRGCHAD